MVVATGAGVSDGSESGSGRSGTTAGTIGAASASAPTLVISSASSNPEREGNDGRGADRRTAPLVSVTVASSSRTMRTWPLASAETSFCARAASTSASSAVPSSTRVGGSSIGAATIARATACAFLRSSVLSEDNVGRAARTAARREEDGAIASGVIATHVPRGPASERPVTLLGPFA